MYRFKDPAIKMWRREVNELAKKKNGFRLIIIRQIKFKLFRLKK